jgi:hypothetical protein
VLFRHILAGSLALSALWAGGPAVAGDADIGSAERMLRAIYAPYLGAHADEAAPPDFMRDKKFQENYEASLAALVKEHSVLEDKVGEPLGLESDIFAHGQDWDIRKVDVAVHLGAGGHAAATVSFVSADQPDAVDFDLVWLKGRWRIAELYWKDQDWSFRQQLVDDIQEAKSELAHPSKGGD